MKLKIMTIKAWKIISIVMIAKIHLSILSK